MHACDLHALAAPTIRQLRRIKTSNPALNVIALRPRALIIKSADRDPVLRVRFINEIKDQLPRPAARVSADSRPLELDVQLRVNLFALIHVSGLAERTAADIKCLLVSEQVNHPVKEIIFLDLYLDGSSRNRKQKDCTSDNSRNNVLVFHLDPILQSTYQ